MEQKNAPLSTTAKVLSVPLQLVEDKYSEKLTLGFPWAILLMSVPMPHDFQLLPSFRLEDILILFYLKQAKR